MPDITLQCYKWTTQDETIEYNGASRKYTTIHGWTLDRESKPALIRVENFRPRCYVELPFVVNDAKHDWPSLWRHVYEGLKKALRDDAPSDGDYIEMEKIYFYRKGLRFPMLRLEFLTLDAMNHCRNLLKNPILFRRSPIESLGHLALGVWETDVLHHHKMLTAQDMTYASWFTAQGEDFPEPMKVSTVKEYLVQYQDIKPVPAEKCATWSTIPKVLALDIECYSDKHKAMPKQYYKLHVVTMISLVVRPFRDSRRTKRYGIVLGSCDAIPDNVLANTEIINIKDEWEFFPAMAAIIKKEDPEIITGYNIWGFDFRYLNARLSFDRMKWPEMGRIVGGATSCRETRWKSDAYGYNILTLLDIPGRITLDTMIFVKRNYNNLIRYDLGTVGKKFLGRGKHDVSPEYMFIAHEERMEAEKEFELALQAIEKDPSDSKVQYHFQRAKTMLEKAKDKTMKIMRYCLEDSELVLDLFDKLVIWINVVESVNVTMVSLEKYLSGGQQGQCFAQLYYHAYHHQIVIDHVLFDNYEVGGGSVQPPEPGLEDGVFCLDFKSLYPSIMIAYNICYTTLIPENLWGAIPEELCWIIKFTQEENQEESDDEDDDDDAPKKPKKPKVFRDYEYRFIKPTKEGYVDYKLPDGKVVRIPAPKGIIPRIVEGLLATRRAVQAQMKKHAEGSFEHTMLNIRQTKVKLTANSLYGFQAVKKGKMSFPPGGRCITAKGREHIAQVNDYLINVHDCLIAYGDTDSSMAKPNGTTAKYGNVDYIAVWARAEKAMLGINGIPAKKNEAGEIIAPAVPGLFPPPLEVELEKIMRILKFSKKRYAYVTVSKKGELRFTDDKGNSMIQKKGIVQARRDNCLFVKRLCDVVLEAALRRRPITEPLRVIIDEVEKMYSGQLDIREFVFVKQLGSNYKSPTNSMKVFSDFLRQNGAIVNPGDRLDYVVAKDPSCTRVGERMRSPELLLERGEELDHEYYLEKQLRTHLNQIFYHGYQNIIDTMLKEPLYKPRHGKAIGLQDITKLILVFKKFGQPLEGIFTTVKKRIQRRIVIQPKKA